LFDYQIRFEIQFTWVVQESNAVVKNPIIITNGTLCEGLEVISDTSNTVLFAGSAENSFVNKSGVLLTLQVLISFTYTIRVICSLQRFYNTLSYPICKGVIRVPVFIRFFHIKLFRALFGED